jgi:hypothetical protein
VGQADSQIGTARKKTALGGIRLESKIIVISNQGLGIILEGGKRSAQIEIGLGRRVVFGDKLHQEGYGAFVVPPGPRRHRLAELPLPFGGASL